MLCGLTVLMFTRMCLGQDNETECDYECPELEEGADGYICAMTESQTAEDTGKSEIGYEPPAYAGTVKPPRRLREANIHDCYSRGKTKQ